MKDRIVGIDIARALAVIGMIVVNFGIALGAQGGGWTKTTIGMLEGKAAATFVVLAGVGVAFATKSAVVDTNRRVLRGGQWRIAKRAVLLFVIGLSYVPIWPADILHFYGVYMLITMFFLRSSSALILMTALLIVLAYPILMMVLDYESGWNFETLTYTDFWTAKGFLRNLFYNGFHPVLPWVAFMLVGLWLGKQHLTSSVFLKRTLWTSLGIFALVQLISFISVAILSGRDLAEADELKYILGTSPMPPLPLYMISGSSIAVFTIIFCIIVARKAANIWIVRALEKTGQLALTFYIAHVVIGMGTIEGINPEKMGDYAVSFSFTYACAFCIACVLFAVVWRKYRRVGPLEWAVRWFVS